MQKEGTEYNWSKMKEVRVKLLTLNRVLIQAVK